MAFGGISELDSSGDGINELKGLFEPLLDVFEDSTTEAWNASANSTWAPEDDSGLDPTLLTVYNVLIIAQVSFLMLTVGTAVTFDGVRNVLRRPKGLIIGLFCQLLLMPLLCFAVAQALGLQPAIAIGMIVVASCPGGAPSNLFTMLSGGDVPLSVVMTAFSSVLALATMPLNIFLYTRSWDMNNNAVASTPYINILIGVVFTWAPGLVGMLLRRRFPQKAPQLTRGGGLLALCVLIAFFLLNRVLFPGVFSLRWGVWYAAISMPLIGWLFAFGIAMLFQVNREQRKAIAFGTSLVNGGLGVALISLTYEGANDLEDMLQFPMLYMALQVFDAVFLVVMVRVFWCARDQTTCCQKLYFKATGKIPRRQREKMEEEKAEAELDNMAVIVDEKGNVVGNLTTAAPYDLDLELSPVDNVFQNGLYLPRSTSQCTECSQTELVRDRAFSV